MTDRELLELAAKAMSYELIFDDNDPQIAFETESFGWTVRWNPLTNDGDALRMAVKLGVDLQNMVLPTGNSRPTNSEGRGVAFPVNGSYERIVEWYTDEDAVAATRRAITRAAAAIQEARESK